MSSDSTVRLYPGTGCKCHRRDHPARWDCWRSAVPVWLEPAPAGAAVGDGADEAAAGAPQLSDLGVDAVDDGLEAPELAGLPGLAGVVGAHGVDDLVEGEAELLQ